MIKVKDNNYEDLEQALADIPTDNKEEIIIDVQGVIKGQLRIAKPHLRIRNATFINNYGGYEILDDGIKRGTFRSYTLFIDADDVTLENVKVINDSGYDHGRSLQGTKLRNIFLSGHIVSCPLAARRIRKGRIQRTFGKQGKEDAQGSI